MFREFIWRCIADMCSAIAAWVARKNAPVVVRPVKAMGDWIVFGKSSMLGSADPFERHGRWWDARTPDAVWYGTLTFTGKSSTRLRVTTRMTAREFSNPNRDRRHPLIHGITDAGEPVSLLGCFERRGRKQSEDDHADFEITANQVVFGLHVAEPEALVSEVVATFDGAREWAARSGLNIDVRQAVQGNCKVTFERPDDIVLVDDGDLRVTLHWALDGVPITADSGDIAVTELVNFVVTVEKPRPLRAVLEIVYAIQNLLSVASLRFCALQRLVIPVGDLFEPPKHGTYHVPPRYEDTRTARREVDAHLFSLTDVEDPRRLFSLLFEKEKKLRSIFGLYLTGQYIDRAIGAKVLSLTQACEVFHRRFRSGTGTYVDPEVFANDVLPALQAGVPANLAREVREAMLNRFKFFNEVSLGVRLKELARENGDVWKANNINPKRLLRLAGDLRNQLVHFSSEEEDIDESRARDLVDCASVLATMIECSILRELGFSPEAVTALAERSDTYYLRFAR